MRTSSDHILSSHVGSLPRPDELIAANRTRGIGERVDDTTFQANLRNAVAEVAPVGKAGQYDLAGPRTPRRHRVHVGAGEVEPTQAMVAIAHPRAVIDALPHRLAVLAVAGNIDADLHLAAKVSGARRAGLADSIPGPA